jgi:Na+-translocating ferredoxin:NAD+ oxidoreductase subunit G
MATPQSDAPPARGVLRPAWILAAVASFAFGLIALVHEATRDDIAAAARARLLARFDDVLAGERYDNDLLLDRVEVSDSELLGTQAPVPVYRARRDGAVVAVVLAPVAPGGYSGPIHLLVGIGRDGTVLGVRVTEHRETPGLGDAIDARKSDWIQGFNGRSLQDPAPERWAVRKDGGAFDQFTGATITPRAVVGAVANALLYFERHRDELLGEPATITP